jgi:hypothetical protein
MCARCLEGDAIRWDDAALKVGSRFAGEAYIAGGKAES